MNGNSELRQQIAAVEARLAISEFDFPSRVPVLGPIIRAFRRGWNSVATRWYVGHYARQQSEFNVAVLRVLQFFQDHYLALDERQVRLSAELNELARDSLKRDEDELARAQTVSAQLGELASQADNLARDSLQRDEEGLARDQALSAQIAQLAQKTRWADELFNRDLQAIARRLNGD